MRVLNALVLIVMVTVLLGLAGGLLFDVLLTQPRVYP